MLADVTLALTVFLVSLLLSVILYIRPLFSAMHWYHIRCVLRPRYESKVCFFFDDNVFMRVFTKWKRIVILKLQISLKTNYMCRWIFRLPSTTNIYFPVLFLIIISHLSSPASHHLYRYSWLTNKPLLVTSRLATRLRIPSLPNLNLQHVEYNVRSLHQFRVLLQSHVNPRYERDPYVLVMID